MRSFTRPFVSSVITLILLAGLGSAARAADGADLTGVYSAEGVGVKGAKYAADVTLTRHGDTYLIHWKFTDGGFDGVAIRQGDTLAVGWSNHDKAGVVLYTIKGTTLEGKWADGSTNGQVYTETLTKK